MRGDSTNLESTSKSSALPSDFNIPEGNPSGGLARTPSTSSTSETLDRRGYEETTPIGGRSTGATISEKPGAVIGRYKLVQQIGEGGFGLVFLAEQERPVRRKVALKIIKLGMDTREVIARFEAERQALALMDHPHVAKVLDAGATETGRPYFVMEFVEGVAITKYCDRRELSLNDRLQLFIQVCGAVQHAHQKGIIHRDIKPSNVLIAELDGKPVPKVIDFGIAKATQQKLTDRTMFTELGQFLGTPAYMSPEQAEMSGSDVDTRSDIYSLGVLLYELLTGTTPFDPDTLRKAAITEIQRLIREEEPRKPSTRLLTVEGLANIARLRRLDEKRIKSALRGDLDWIIMKALEKDRRRRYDSAADFAKDIQRYLNHEPVTAGPPSASYRLQKFVRRNRGGVAVGAVALIALMGFAATMAVQAKRIAAERDRANKEREISDHVVQFQEEMLERISPAKLGESFVADLRSRLGAAMSENGKLEDEREAAQASLDSLVRQVNVTDTARAVLDANILAPAKSAIEAQFTGSPMLEARLQYALATTYLSLGLHEESLARSQRALDLYRVELGEEHRDTIRAIVAQAMILWELGRDQETRDILVKSIPAAERVLGPEDRETLRAKLCLLVLKINYGLAAKTRQQYEELLPVLERVLGPEDPEFAIAISNYAVVLINQHLFAEAIPPAERSLAIHHKLSDGMSGHAMFAMQTLAKAYQGAGRVDEAITIQTEALEAMERIKGLKHPDTADAVANLSQLYRSQSRFQEAEPIAKKALAMARVAYGDSHRTTNKVMTDVGITLGMLGRHHEAEPYFLEAYENSKKIFGDDHSETMDNLNNLAVHYWYLGQYHKAVATFEEILSWRERRLGKDHVDSTAAMQNLAILYTKLGRLDESRELLDRAVAVRTKAFGIDHPRTLEARASQANVIQEQDKEKGVALYEELLAAQKRVLGVDHVYTLQSMYNLAEVLIALERHEEAAALLADALERRRRVVGPTHHETLDTMAELARMRHELGNTEEARSLFTEVISGRRAAAASPNASPAELNACALVLLNCPVEDLRSPSEALQQAQQAASATDFADPLYLGTLARALFLTGDQAKAVEMQRTAISLLPEQSPHRAEYEKSLAEYAAGTGD